MPLENRRIIIIVERDSRRRLDLFRLRHAADKQRRSRLRRVKLGVEKIAREISRFRFRFISGALCAAERSLRKHRRSLSRSETALPVFLHFPRRSSALLPIRDLSPESAQLIILETASAIRAADDYATIISWNCGVSCRPGVHSKAHRCDSARTRSRGPVRDRRVGQRFVDALCLWQC